MADASLKVRVTPRASRNQAVRDGEIVKVFVTAAPADGQANTAVIETLSKALAVPKSRIEIASGSTSRNKSVHIGGMNQDQLNKLVKERLE